MTNKKGGLEPIETIHLTSDIVAAYVSNNAVKSDQLPGLLQKIYGVVSDLADADPSFSGRREPAVPVAKSITPDYVICLEDGKKLKMLKRYLRTHYDLSPEEYRRKWGLPADYPMVAPNYAKRRSQVAKVIGLGTTAAVRSRSKAKAKTTSRKKKSAA